jgi:hypothetical protein
MTREEHLEWARDRALDALDGGDPQEAWRSMASDMTKHPKLAHEAKRAQDSKALLISGELDPPGKMREWIESFR